MEPDTLRALLDPASLALLDGVEYERGRELQIATRLRSELAERGLPAGLAAALVTQAELRQAAPAKFGPFADSLLFTRDGLAQATRLPVAAHHAGRMRQAALRAGLDFESAPIADLGCGIGADSLAFGGLGAPVIAIDADEVTAALAAYNLRHLEKVTVEHGRAEDFDPERAELLWLDPARRSGTKRGGQARRLNDPEDFSPSLSWAFGAAADYAGTGIKLGPALDHGLIPAGWEAQWVSHTGDVVEVALYHGAAARAPGRTALVLGPAGAAEVSQADLPATATPEDGLGTLGTYLFEPDGAVIRAGLVTALCGPLGAHRLHEQIAYLTGERPAEGTAARLVRTFRIVDTLPTKVKPLRAELIRRGIGRVVIKKRGADIVPDVLRRQLRLPAGDPATLVFTRLGDRHIALLVEEVVEETKDRP